MNSHSPKGHRAPEDVIWGIAEPPCHVEEQGVVYSGSFQSVLGTLPSGSVDLIVTDPPYGINFRGCRQRQTAHPVRAKRVPSEIKNLIAHDTADQALSQMNAFLLYASRLLRPGGCCCVCCPGGGRRISILNNWTRLISRHLKLKELVVWDKGSLGLGPHYRSNYEFVIVATKAGSPCKWHGKSDVPNVVRINRRIPRAGDHPTPKPIGLMAHFIGLHSKVGDLVLDPFAGQGPTLVAAKRLGRKFIGIEIEQRHCEVVVKRLTSAESDSYQSDVNVQEVY